MFAGNFVVLEHRSAAQLHGDVFLLRSSVNITLIASIMQEQGVMFPVFVGQILEANPYVSDGFGMLLDGSLLCTTLE
ncbi:hypothetical protein AAES_103868 [Amazona aestiva]|uniref:Uncharacterized protein n=1 Tax=Amazona aestiva TaxID=12930 RepID=A0A0Q3R244_AMAAE|nr:hypothetical protein AAES_103868 [Amazona aestiva]